MTDRTDSTHIKKRGKITWRLYFSFKTTDAQLRFWAELLRFDL